MEAQRQPNGATGVAAQPMSDRALLRGVSREGLTNGVRFANVGGVKIRPTASGAVAVVAQPAPSAVLLNVVAAERLASGVRCAKVADMNRRADAKSRGGGGALLPSLAV